MLQLYVPTVETKRLIIRPIRLEDANDLYAIAGDERVNQYLLYPLHESVEQTRDVIERLFLTRPANNVPEATVLVEKASGKMIGTCDFVGVTRGDSAEIGYSLNYDYWGQGLMSEAVAKVIELGFTQIGLRRIEIVHNVYNLRSQRVIEKCGFVYEGTYREYVYDKERNCYVDCKHYSILKKEWSKKYENISSEI